MTKIKKLSSENQAETTLDAVRRHLCQILGFDIGIIEFVNGDELVTVAQVSADTKRQATDLVNSLVDQNGESISFANTELALSAKNSQQPLVSQVFSHDGSKKKSDQENTENISYPYAIIPIGSPRHSATNVLGPIFGLIRVISLDHKRQISEHDLSTLKLTGEHLIRQLLKYGQIMGLKSPSSINNKEIDTIGGKILLVHTNRLVRRRFSRILSNDYQVLETDNIEKAAELLASENVDLIFLDTQFPEAAHQTLCKQVKDSPQWQHIPIVLITPGTDPNARVEGQNLGIDDYLVETCLDQELLARTKSTLRFCQAQNELSRQSQLLENYSQRLEDASGKLSSNEQNQLQRSREIQILKWESEVLRNQESLLHRISDTIRRSFNIEQNLRDMLSELAGYFNLDGCFITLPAPNLPEDEIRCEYASHEDYKVIEFNLDLKTFAAFEKHYKSDEPLVINQVADDARVEPFRKEALSRHHVLSLFYIPISYEEKLLGLLCGFKCESEARWNQDNVTFLKSVADQIAIGVTNARLYARVQRQATTDGLTGLFNHRTGQEKLSEQLRVSERYQRNLAVMMIDVDHFKSINDSYGHPVGDAVLKGVAKLIQRDCRDVDLPIRYGGEEFLLVLPEVNIDGAMIVAERIRKNLSEEIIAYDDLEIKVTASIGVASFPEHARSQQQLLDIADRALYLAKRTGRNQVHSVADLNFETETDEKSADIAAQTSSAEVAQSIHEKPELTLPPEPEPETQSTEKEELMPEVVEMVKALAAALYSKSEYNKIHHLETARLSEVLARVMGLSQKQIEQIRVAGLLHDVGTLSIPTELINKEGMFTQEEREIVKQHPMLGAELLRPIRALKEICDILENHHERWDGTGYPRGLKGEEIPLPARIVSIVDSYHALISDRPYRTAMSEEEALSTLKEGAGTQWDPFLVDIFISIINNLKQNNNPARAHFEG